MGKDFEKLMKLTNWVECKRSLAWMMSENENLDKRDRDEWLARWACYVDFTREINDIYGTDFNIYGED